MSLPDSQQIFWKIAFLRGWKENSVKVGQLVQPFPVLQELGEMMVWTQQSI